MKTESTLSIELSAGELSDIIKRHLNLTPTMMKLNIIPLFTLTDEPYKLTGVRIEGEHTNISYIPVKHKFKL